jgi:hypothetical protein
VRQMSPIFFYDASRSGSDSGFPERLVEGVFCTESGKEAPKFMGGSDQSTDNPGRFEQSGQFLQIAQSRIDTGN